MLQSYMSKACCQWPHDSYPGLAYSGRVVHGCMPVPNPFYMFSSYISLYHSILGQYVGV